ncbi:glycosyltransferase [Nocardia sp. NPDC049220]|uniref:glycosyltransferase n=1 Tax=Nocardia sp. NPDC049220 TaxID=3155273 RepID=UPI0033FCFB0F
MSAVRRLPSSRDNAVRVAPSAVAVVVPVHNEEALLSRCLWSLQCAAHMVPIPVRVIVVLDSCVDGSARLVPASMAIVRVDAGNVGVARAAGFAFAAEQYGLAGAEHLWYATTDADSSVPTRWLAKQLSHAVIADVTVGTVAVQWRERTAAVRAEYERRYHRIARDSPRHVHGANLGFRATWYHRVGGFAPVRVDEDIDLVARLEAAGARVLWHDSAVRTSDRHDNRVTGGFEGYLTDLADTSPDCA